jgi:hypothetical protein
MPVSNSYVRALVANLAIFVVFVAWAFYMHGAPLSRYHAAALVVGGAVGLIVTLLVGTFLRLGGKSWPWWFFGFASVGCWAVILLALLFFTPHSGDLMQVKP